MGAINENSSTIAVEGIGIPCRAAREEADGSRAEGLLTTLCPWRVEGRLACEDVAPPRRLHGDRIRLECDLTRNGFQQADAAHVWSHQGVRVDSTGVRIHRHQASGAGESEGDIETCGR